MKKVYVLIVFWGLLTSCTRDKDNISPGLVGSWELIEALADPGDGSGTFQAVDNGRVIELHSDGLVLADEDLCALNSESGEVRVVGTYSVADSTILPSECNSTTFKINFYLENNDLILSYPCIEPCLQKYRKIQ